jgi:oligoendopeptidase F
MNNVNNNLLNISQEMYKILSVILNNDVLKSWAWENLNLDPENSTNNSIASAVETVLKQYEELNLF